MNERGRVKEALYNKVERCYIVLTKKAAEAQAAAPQGVFDAQFPKREVD